MVVICKNCNSNVSEGYGFCPKCGKKMTESDMSCASGGNAFKSAGKEGSGIRINMGKQQTTSTRYERESKNVDFEKNHEDDVATPHVRSRFCASCGQKMSEGARFCSFCGYRDGAKTESASDVVNATVSNIKNLSVASVKEIAKSNVKVVINVVLLILSTALSWFDCVTVEIDSWLTKNTDSGCMFEGGEGVGFFVSIGVIAVAAFMAYRFFVGALNKKSIFVLSIIASAIHSFLLFVFLEANLSQSSSEYAEINAKITGAGWALIIVLVANFVFSFMNISDVKKRS